MWVAYHAWQLIWSVPMQGFDQARVIDVLSRRNYRGSNVQNVSDDDILNSLLG